MATISLVMIVKNEEEILERCIDSVKEIVDEFVIVDTGSTDSTKEIIAKYGPVHEIPFEDFVTTKNKALKLATGDYILFMDADERIYQNLHKLREYVEAGVECVACDITEGSPDISITTNVYSRCRLWRNNGLWQFEGPGVHECIVGPDRVITDKSILVRHEHLKKNKQATSRERFEGYVRILKDHIAKHPNDTRAWFYLGRTHKDLCNWLPAISAYIKYLAIPGNSYRDERWQSAYDMAECYMALGEYDKAFKALDTAAVIDHRRAEAMNLRGRLYLNLQDYDAAIRCFRCAFQMPVPEDVILFLNPEEHNLLPHDNLTLAHYYAKNFKEAEEHCEIVRAALPYPNQRIMANMWWTRRKTHMNVFLTLGPTPEKIYGGILNDQGVHGVETTYIELAKELAVLGHNVFLFCTTDREHVYDGVYYIPYQQTEAYFNITPDVVITSRWFDPLYVEDISKKVIWLQDSHFADPNRPDAFSRADLVICSSEWHRQYIAQRFSTGIKASKIKVIPLGIRKALFEEPVEKIPGRVIYSSNPDRGLYILADMWPELTKQVPGISLEILYGWEGLKTWNDSPEWQNSVEYQKAMLLDKLAGYENVTFTGRVTKAEVAKKMLAAEVMLYPNNFWETFCLTTLESQAAGTPVVTSDLGALATTVKRDLNILIEDDPFSAEYQKKFITEAVSLMKDRPRLAKLSKKNRQRVMEMPCDWTDIAEIWQRTIWQEMD